MWIDISEERITSNFSRFLMHTQHENETTDQKNKAESHVLHNPLLRVSCQLQEKQNLATVWGILLNNLSTVYLILKYSIEYLYIFLIVCVDSIIEDLRPLLLAIEHHDLTSRYKGGGQYNF
jgi:hypothetical protein